MPKNSLMTMSPLKIGILTAILGVSISSARADLIGTTPIAPGTTVFPGLVTPGTLAGTLLADQVAVFSYTTAAGTNTGTIESAVYMEAGGTLDFYYQVDNNSTSATDLARLTATDFANYLLAVGYRTDGSTLTGTSFTNGTVAPVTADLNSAGSVVGFSFAPPDSDEIAPGEDSNVLVISTNATSFTAGNASIIDGGTATVGAYEPTATRATPEPSSLILLGSGLLGFAGVMRRRFK